MTSVMWLIVEVPVWTLENAFVPWGQLWDQMDRLALVRSLYTKKYENQKGNTKPGESSEVGKIKKLHHYKGMGSTFLK